MYPPQLIHHALSRLESADTKGNAEAIEDVAREIGIGVAVLRQWQARYSGMTIRDLAALQARASAIIATACSLAQARHSAQLARGEGAQAPL